MDNEKTIIKNPFIKAKGIQEKREILKSISKDAKVAIKINPILTVNDALLIMYGGKEYNTYKQWKKQGKTVKKGSKAYCIWGKPIVNKKENKDKKDKKESMYSMYPIAHIFSENQVEEFNSLNKTK